MDGSIEGRVKGDYHMSKDHGRLAEDYREQPAATSVRRPKRGRVTRFHGRLENGEGRRPMSPDGDRRRGLAQDLPLLASGLGRVATQPFRHVRIGRFRAALADAQQLVCKHPLQAVLVGVGLGYLLSRTKVR